ncbi:MAG: low-specificity L-threonine aldolase [Clostridiales bacterium]|jgi:threonine aldolase|nr:low-specificity L-threonine aldolase [Clostridiales bacterium]
MKYIDLRSDTVTLPTREMREAMASAVCGDDVYVDDPTVKQLEELAAKMCGKEAAIFMPSGTMANQAAIMTFCKRGDEIILGRRAHIAAYEAGAAAVLAGVSYALIDKPDEIITAKDVAENVRGEDVHFPDTGLLCLENALGSGRVLSLEQMKAAYDEAKRHGLPVYLDGARIFNAAVHLGASAAEIAQYCDALMFCISKGLAAPIGSLLCGTKDFIARARRNRKILGGGMRQAGILAAAGLVSLEVMTKRLHIDHENADYLAAELAKIPGISVDDTRRDINLVFFAIESEGFDHENFPAAMAEKGVKINGAVKGVYRFVTHNDIGREDIDYVLTLVGDYIIMEG